MSTIYQHGTLELIMSGLYDGTAPLSAILNHGSSGIGTMDELDGEVTIIENSVYQTKASGVTKKITDLSLKTPFTSIHSQSELHYLLQEKILTFDSLNNISKQHQSWVNLPASIQINASFSKLKVRVAPKQMKPYPPFVAVTLKQPVFNYENVSGTLIGDFGPDLYSGITASGWHLHFLSDDRTIGGHVLDFNASDVFGRIDLFNELNIALPTHNSDFNNHEADILNIREAIDAAER
ncbi:acetolactate decarboxylase [Leuconostoc suionicum]|uniref:acetolactate decarboxylase n=1 Tax=Leuconostoc suionicum TaxID=1511761 RepID=UPI0021A2870A|nr:acetolactate decarboxylase [Leuconostoc suionicum]MCT4376894.1 acetolactate decarboxylase [Leuconostoc suionicum]